MSSEGHLPTGHAEPVEPRVVAFGDPVEHDVGVRDREQVLGNVRWALVEYAPGSQREGWCTQPHMGYRLRTELTRSHANRCI